MSLAPLVLLARRYLFACAIASTERVTRPSIGAIRWDAWYDPSDGTVAVAVEDALGPARYHLRMPFFGRETDFDRVRIDGYSQVTMDEEIEYAHSAGLSYWAFDAYARTSPMSNALKLYLSSSKRGMIDFCLLTDIGSLANQNLISWQRELLREESYQCVLDRRPIFFILLPGPEAVNRIGGIARAQILVERFRETVASGGPGSPYLVLLNQIPSLVAQYAEKLGCDAIGAYAINRNLPHAPFAQLAEDTKELWDQFAATGLSVVPPITTGFDRRPRAEHPVPWEHQSTVGETAVEIYYETAKPKEIADELAECIKWIRAHPRVAPANTALIYAWNEFDEGGWLCPTYRGDLSRLEALRRVLVGAE